MEFKGTHLDFRFLSSLPFAHRKFIVCNIKMLLIMKNGKVSILQELMDEEEL
jgi:hypothetical protein